MHASDPRPRIGVTVQRICGSYNGVHEERANEEQLRASVDYQMVVAAASENGSYGVQAWFRKSLGPGFLAFNVVNPRLMAVAATLSKLSVFVALIVGHAPTSVLDLEDRSSFFVKQAI